MKTIEISVYQFDELNEQAKERAREGYREWALDYEWWDYIYDDAENVGLKLTEFDLDRNRHAKGTLLEDARSVAQKIVQEHGPDCATHKTASSFLSEVEKLNAETEEYEDNLEALTKDFTHDLLEDYAIMLQQEYEYRLSDEQVDEAIRANEYEFLESGKPV